MRHYLLLAVFTLASLSMQAQKLCFAGETAEPKTSQVLKKASAKTVCKEVIKVQPEGEKTCYYHVSDAYYPTGDYVYKRHYDGGAAYVVDGTDGNVYIKNPISAFSPGSWIKAEKNGDGALTVKLPQDIYDGIIEDDNGNEQAVDWEVRLLKLNAEGNSYEPDNARTEMVLNRDEDGTIWMNAGDVIGIVDKATGEWIGFCDYNTRLEAINEYKVVVPEDINDKAEKCLVIYNYGQKAPMAEPMNVAFYDNEVYINVRQGDPELWMCGKIEGNKVTVPAFEYLGIYNDFYGKHLFVAPVTYEQINDDGAWYNYYTLSNNDIVFDYDPETRTLTTEDALVINGGKYSVEYLTEFCEMKVKKYSDKIGSPKDPVISCFFKYFAENDWGMIEFQQAPLTTSDDYLPFGNIFFNIFFDDQLVTFQPGEYIHLKEPMTDIPYIFQEIEKDEDNNILPDFEVYGNGQAVYYYRDNIERVGVQTFVYDNGNKLKSNIIYSDGTVVSSVNDIHAFGNAKGTRYYDMQGRSISKPQRGIYIRSNGKQTQKFVVR